MYNIPEGVLLADVTENGPAAKAGIRAQDILTELDGKKAVSMADLREIMASHKVGDTIKVTYWREGKTTTVDVKLEALS
jgi:serine protease Do